MTVKHIDLLVEQGKFRTQPVEVEQITQNKFKVLYTPGMVEGIASEDHIEITDYDTGEFKVIKRGGNVAIKIFSKVKIANYMEEIENALLPIGGKCDGAIAKACVWTVKLSETSFSKIDSAMNSVISVVPESVWWYGNVYDKSDKPLNWWKN